MKELFENIYIFLIYFIANNKKEFFLQFKMSEKSNVDHVDDDDGDSIASGSVGATAASNVNKPNYPGPKPDVKYPIAVIYCGGRCFF